MPVPSPRQFRVLLPYVAVIAAYYLAVRLGMLFVLPAANVSLIWPASGVALAAVWLFGLPQAVAVVAAAFAAQVTMGHDPLPSLAVAAGAGVAAVVAVLALRRCGFDAAFGRLGDVLRFALFGAVLSSAVSSLTGAGVLYTAGLTQWQGFGSLWWVCWVADLMGVLLVAPVLLTAAANRDRRPGVEPVVMAAAVALAAWVVYSDVLPSGVAMAKPLSYVVFPIMICAAVRNTPRTVAVLLLLHAAVAVAYTAGGHGPFAGGVLRENLLSLHAHLAMVSLTTLLLAAALIERRSAEAARRRAEEESREHLYELAHVGRISAMGEMAAGLAHELNQPLCAITTYAQACLRLLGPAPDPELRRAIERVAANSQRAGDIMRQMRTFVRKEPVETEPADINDLVREGLALTAAETRQAGVAVETRLAAGVPPVAVAAIQIHQVMVNLVRNAVEALCGQLPASRRRLMVRTWATDDGVEVVVADTGPGLPADLLDSLFEPFVTGRPQGLGLGLSISRSIVESHGGQMTAANRRGGGAEFHIRLPAARRQAREAG